MPSNARAWLVAVQWAGPWKAAGILGYFAGSLGDVRFKILDVIKDRFALLATSQKSIRVAKVYW